MGVPKFFRYMSERYPCLCEKLKEYQIPEFDNLYLDMNGIIHNCSHPNDADVSFRISEEKIFKNIFHYIEILFRIIQPQKLFFMAVDGVAPRAKINQQRGRRFRSAKEAEVLEAKAKAKGETIPKEARFDSNCITPGTEFMAKLNEQLKYFVNYKITTDKLWQKCKIVLSGSEVPGEGEHKIMDYIRYMKSQADYDGNTRHCLYGLDADLIMLGLCSHEPHFSLLREEVKFGKVQKKILTPEEQNFCLLHLSLMREYLELEFSPVKDKLPFKFDIEKIIDDWILMGFLVGNDFIPHLPNLHIENDALPILYNAYMEVLPTLDGYINQSGFLNLERFEKFMERLASLDLEKFDETFMDFKYLEEKSGKKSNYESPKKELKKEIASMLLEFDDDDDIEDSEDELHTEFVLHKRDYYMSKMDYGSVDEETLRSQAEGYVRAIQWNLHYYYNGCCSWSWYYPHHYAPYISDIKNFKHLKLSFELGEPFLPFQQLLAVLPTASKDLLPRAYHGLMMNESSPIFNYYPVDFKTDLNGKRHDWEAVVLIPIIDEKNLLDAMAPFNEKLTPEEKKRNSHGPMSIFSYSEQPTGICEAPAYFPSLLSHAKMELVDRHEILVPVGKLVKGLCKGVRLSIYYPGFPTLQHIPHTATLEKAKVKVFEQPSRGENMVLSVIPQKPPLITEVAQKILGKSVYIGWPHLREALVISVSDALKKISLQGGQTKNSDGSVPFNVEEMDDKLVPYWNLQRKSIAENYRSRLGIDVGPINILVHAKLIVGRQYVYTTQGKMTLEKQWNEIAMPFAYQVVVHDITVHAPDYVQFTSISDVFTPKLNCFMLGHPYYGSMGEVGDPAIDVKTSRIRISMRHITEPNFDAIVQLQADTKQRYVTGSQACQRLGISSHLLSRITGTIFVLLDDSLDSSNCAKQNIGLNLKFNKKNEEVPGYTKRDMGGTWLYSSKAVDLVNSYMQKFPVLFENLEKSMGSNDMFLISELFPDQNGDVTAIADWLKEQTKTLGLYSRSCGVEQIDPEIVAEIEKEVDNYLMVQKSMSKTISMQVKPHLLYKAGLNQGHMAPDPQAFHRLFDRIVSVRESYGVPFGYKGTIIGCTKGENSIENMYEVVFDKPFAGGLVINGCSPNRGYRLAVTDFINISYGIRVENKNNNKSVASPLSWRQTPSNSNMSNSPDLHLTKNSSQKFFGEPSNYSKTNPIVINQQKLQQMFNSQQNKMPAFPVWPNNPYQGANLQFYPQMSMKPCEMPRPPMHKQEPTEYESLWKELQIPKPRQVSSQFPQQVLPPNQNFPPVHREPVVPTTSEINKPRQVSSQFPQQVLPPNQNFPPVHREPVVPTTSKINLQDSQTWPQDPSLLLKALLKIDDGSQTKPPMPSAPAAPTAISKPPPALPAFAQLPQSMDTPPLVQQMFDHARQSSEMKSVTESNKYGSLLLSHFQKLGIGFPRFNYMQQPKNNTYCAEIVLPDSRFFHGDFCSSTSEAAENAAKKVYYELKLDTYQYGPRLPPSQQPPPAPQQWNYNLRPNMVRPSIPNMPPILPSAFPSTPMPPMPSSKWMQPNAPPPQNQPPPPLMSLPCAPPPPQLVNNVVKPQSNWFPQQKQQQQSAPKNLDNQAKPVIKTEHPSGNPAASFVPLQAQKKSRNVEVKQNVSKTQKNPGKEVNSQDAKNKPGSMKDKSDKVINKKEGPENTNANSSQRSQKTTNQRRSRIAAKFHAVPTPNGSSRQ